MRTSETIEKLAVAMTAAQAELKNAAFDKENPHFKSRYATLAAVRDTVAPTLSKHELSVVQTTDFDGGAWLVQTRIIHTSGQWIESVYPFAIDKPQQMGSALTYARRYSLSMICGIASEEDDDGNEAQKGVNSPQIPRTSNPMDKPITKEETRALKDELCREIETHTSAMKLRDWAKVPENRSRKASLHPDFQDVVSQSWLDKLGELEKGLAA